MKAFCVWVAITLAVMAIIGGFALLGLIKTCQFVLMAGVAASMSLILGLPAIMAEREINRMSPKERRELDKMSQSIWDVGTGGVWRLF